jgi:transposase InsO family protein
MPQKKTPGWLHTMLILSRPWESIGMDFTGPFVKVGGFNYILLIICRMTGMVHLIPTRTDATAKQVTMLYVKEVIRLHGIPESIVSDRESKFTSQFWNELSKVLGQRLLMSTAYHPQTDGSSERAIQTMSQVLQSVIDDCQSNWVEQLPLVEFTMNSASSEATGFAPFEVNYGWMPHIIRRVDFNMPRPGVKQFVQDIANMLDKTFDRLLTQRTRQATKANRHRRDGQDFKEGDLVLLSTENINMPKGRTHKLYPKFIGPYKVLKADPKSSTYKLELSSDLQMRRIHNTSHEKLLKPYMLNNDNKFPKRETRMPYDIGDDPERE